MNRKRAWIILFLFVLSLFLRKIGFGLSSVLINVADLFLCIFIISKPLFFKKYSQRILVALFLLLSVAILQYWFQNIHINLPGLKDNSINLLIIFGWLIFSIFIFQNIRNNSLTFTLWFIISFILSTSVILNPREFHNFYRSSTYEEYIRSRYPEQRGIVADLFIDKYKNPDKEESEKYLKAAIDAESLSEYDNALVLYNKSIDLNPDNQFSYYRRGLLKLTRLDLNIDVAYSAIKDFSRTLRLDSTYFIAYFHRGLAFGYLGLKGRSYLDMKKVWESDSTISEEEFQKKYGSSKKSFSKPFYP